MLFEIKLALQFLFLKRKRFYRVARFFTMGTIALSVAALLVSLSAFRGYISILSQRYLDSTSHIIVSDHYGREKDLKAKTRDVLGDRVGDMKYFGYLELLVSSKKAIRGVAFEVFEKGIFDKVLKIDRYMKKGSANCIFKNKGNTIIGSAISDILGLHIGDNFKIVRESVDLNVCGIVDFGLYDLDSRLSYISIDTGEYLFPKAMFSSSLKIRLNEGVDIETAVSDLNQAFMPGVRVNSWRDINYSMFESVKLDRLVIFFILSILIAVSIFNVVATLILLIKEMRTEISILQVLGLNMIRMIRVFFLKALFLGLSGYLIGIVLWGMSLICIYRWGVVVLPKDVYLVSKIPVEVGFVDLLYVLFVVIIFVCAGSIIPLLNLFRRFRKEGTVYGIKGHEA